MAAIGVPCNQTVHVSLNIVGVVGVLGICCIVVQPCTGSMHGIDSVAVRLALLTLVAPL